eukprot:PITA_16469
MYLGLPLARESVKTEIWVKLIEKLRGKLQSWGMSWLNLAGRTTLIKSILSALPIYQFAITLAPASTHKHMELILRSFLWQGGRQDSKKFSLVQWDQVILPFEKGGLGIRIPRLANMVMGFKLIWRILNEKGAWWLGWKHLPLPFNLRDQWVDLKLSLIGLAPLNSLSEDKYVWDPNGGSYTVKEGYKILQNSTATNNWPLHKVAWNPECLPKIKFFNWTLLKRKILTAENLRKKGILGPSICCLCRAAEESSNHLFLECSFARNCWKLITSPLSIGEMPNQINLLQKNWGNSYPYPKKNKTLAKRLWNNIPPTLCWQIWIARNKCIFNNKKPSIPSTLAKSIALISETISANGIVQSNQEIWNPREMEWIGKFSYESRSHKTASTGQKKIDWKLRGSDEEIKEWIQNQKRPSLQFDGASKNNPGQAGAGGVIKDHQGKIFVTYEWGLGIMSNNRAEAYSLLLGTSILRRLGLQNPLIMGDSAIIIAAMVSGREFKQIALNNIKSRIIDNLRDIEGTTFKHVLRSNNKEADKQANKAASRRVGQVRENESSYEKAIP